MIVSKLDGSCKHSMKFVADLPAVLIINTNTPLSCISQPQTRSLTTLLSPLAVLWANLLGRFRYLPRFRTHSRNPGGCSGTEVDYATCRRVHSRATYLRREQQILASWHQDAGHLRDLILGGREGAEVFGVHYVLIALLYPVQTQYLLLAASLFL